MSENGNRSDLLLMGIGGGASRIVTGIMQLYREPMRVLCLDTDALALKSVTDSGAECLLLGGTRLAGHGTGGDAIKGSLAAQDDLETMAQHLQGVRTAVVVACLGGGTGDGVLPDVIKRFRALGIATLGVVTLPFKFEGLQKRRTAERVLSIIEDQTDSLAVLELDKLFDKLEEMTLDVAINQSNAVVGDAVTLLWRLLAKPGFLSVSAETLNRLVSAGGPTHFGSATAQGEGRAKVALKSLLQHKLLNAETSLADAKVALVGILAGDDLRLAEIGELMDAVRKFAPSACKLEMGTVRDPVFAGRIAIVLFTFKNSAAVVLPSAVAKAAVPGEKIPEPPTADVAVPAATSRRNSRRGHSNLTSGATGRGKFTNIDATLWNGQDLDIPTFQRKGIQLER